MRIMLEKRLLLKKTEEERRVTRRMETTKIKKSNVMRGEGHSYRKDTEGEDSVSSCSKGIWIEGHYSDSGGNREEEGM